MKFQYAMKNPSRVFSSPEKLDAAREFTPLQKQAILMQWQDQLKQLLIADEEGMLHPEAANSSAECLRRVTDCMARLTAA